MRNIFIGKNNSIQARFAAIIYKRLLGREWFSYADVMANFKGLKSADELEYLVTADEKEYRALKKAFFMVRDAIQERLGQTYIETSGNIRAKRFRYVGADPDPLADMQFEDYKNTLQDYFDFCQSSAGFMPSSWMEYFLDKTLDLFEIKRRKKGGKLIIGSSIDRKHTNIELLPQLYDYIRQKKAISITYNEGFQTTTALVFHPHYLKEFNGRWHVFGHAEGREPVDAYDIALDRIDGDIEIAKGVEYIKPQVRYPDFFDDIIGTTHVKDTPLYDDIVIRIHNEYMFGLMGTKPLHHSQQTTMPYDQDLGYGEITLKHKTLLRHLNDFKRKVYFEDITVEFLEKFEEFLISKGLTNGYVRQAMKSMKGFFNWATKKGYNPNKAYQGFSAQFRDETKTESGVNTFALTEEELEAIKSFQTTSPAIDRTRDLFLFTCYTGMRYCDASNLRWSNIVDGMIDFVAQKTHQHITIPINRFIQSLFDKYASDNPEDYVGIFRKYLSNCLSV